MINLDLMRKRLEYQGGVHQEDRMIKDKWRSLQKAKLYSYQACTIRKEQDYSEVLPADIQAQKPDIAPFPHDRALINPDKVKQDYDDKILSVNYIYEEPGKLKYQPGVVFEWKKTDSYWIIYSQELTEDAYFRGEIRRCRYRIKFKDKEGKWCSTWAAIRGPIETQIDSIQKNQERIDRPNLSLNILMPRNEKTLHAFDRYSEFLFAGRCWQVEAPNSISMKNIIEVNAEENYINKDTDDIEKEMKNGLVFEPIDPSPDSEIAGPTWIKPNISEFYSIDRQGGKWCVLEKAPVNIKLIAVNQVEVTWTKMISGQFTLQWSKGEEILQKTIVVESLY